MTEDYRCPFAVFFVIDMFLSIAEICHDISFSLMAYSFYHTQSHHYKRKSIYDGCIFIVYIII